MSATRLALLAAVISASALATAAEPAVTLAEPFDDKNVCRVEVKSSISGKIRVPVGEGKPAKVVDLSGSHHFQYDERPLTSEEPTDKKLVRAYRTFDFTRTIVPAGTSCASRMPFTSRLPGFWVACAFTM